MKILIIEDEKLLADSLNALLAKKGFEVECVYLKRKIIHSHKISIVLGQMFNCLGIIIVTDWQVI